MVSGNSVEHQNTKSKVSVSLGGATKVSICLTLKLTLTKMKLILTKLQKYGVPELILTKTLVELGH